jgi:L-amino acid N-acyltransferase YncA
MIRVRRAMPLDTPSMARLLNRIIEAGGTTALTRPVTADDLANWMRYEPGRSAWHVALDDAERVVGFQWIQPHEHLPAKSADIATFVQTGQTGLGIGSALFEATKKAAKSLGYEWINATVRADNSGGLTYYQSRGFRDWHLDEAVRLDSGLVVDKISKRFDL